MLLAIVSPSQGEAATEEAPLPAQDICLSDAPCREMYKRARELSRTGQLDAAVVLYQEAYKRRPATWLLLNIGRVLHRQGKLTQAIASYESYLGSPRPEDEVRLNKARQFLAQAQRELLSKGSAQPAKAQPQSVAATAPAEKPPEPEPPPAPLLLGELPKQAVAAQPAQAPREAAGALPVDSRKPAEPPTPSSSAFRQRVGRDFFIGVGVSGGLLATSVVTGSLALAFGSELSSARYVGPPGEDLLALQGRTRSLAIATDVLLAGAAVALVTVVVMTFAKKRTTPNVRASAFRFVSISPLLSSERSIP